MAKISATGLIFKLKKLLSAFFTNIKSGENLNTIIYLGSSIFSAFAGFIMLRLFTKYLGLEDIGIFGYVTAVNAFLIPFISLNLETFYIREVYNKTGRQNKKELLGTIVSFTLVWALVLTAVLTITGSIIFRMLEIKFPFFPYMFFTLLSNIGSIATTYILVQYRILSKPWSYFIVTFLQTVLLLGGGYLFVGFIHWQIYGRIIGVLLGTSVLGIVSFILLQKHLTWSFNRQVLAIGLKFSLPLVPYSIATVLYDMLDRFFLERYSVNMASTGIYNMGAQYAVIISMLSLAFYRAYEPAIYKLVGEHNEEAVAKNLIMLNNVILILALPLIVLSGWLISYLTHGKFIASAYIGSLLIVGFYFRSSYIMLNTLLSALSRTKEIMWFSLLGLAVVILMSVLLVPTYNNVGTALIKILLYVVMFFSSFAVLHKMKIYRRYMLHTIFTGFLLLGFVLFLKQMNFF